MSQQGYPPGPPGYPPQAPGQQYYQQPQAPAAPQPPGFGAPHGVPQGAAPAPGAPAPIQQAPAGPAPIHMVDPAAMALAWDQARALAEASGGGKFGKRKYFDVLGPGQQPWKTSAHVNYEGFRALYLCPPWKEGLPMPYVQRTKRFWKSANHPKGKTIYADDDSLVAKAVGLAIQQGYNKDTLFLKRNRQFIWQGFAIEIDPNTQQLFPNPQAHVDEQGKLCPMIFYASTRLNDQILREIQTIGGSSTLPDLPGVTDPKVKGMYYTVHPDHGRPFKLGKKKTGEEARKVEWNVTRLEPMPLPDVYRVGLHNLYPLDEIFKEASPEEQVSAIIDAGLPVPPEAQHLIAHGQSQVAVPGGVQAPVQPPQNLGAPPQFPPQQAAYGQPPAPQIPAQLPQGLPQIPPQGQAPVSYQPTAQPPAANPFQGQPVAPTPQAPIPIPQAPTTGMAAAAPPPPPMPAGVPPAQPVSAVPPPPPPQGVATAQPPVTQPPTPPPPPQAQSQAAVPGAPAQPPAEPPQAMTPEQLQATFTGGNPQF